MTKSLKCSKVTRKQDFLVGFVLCEIMLTKIQKEKVFLNFSSFFFPLNFSKAEIWHGDNKYANTITEWRSERPVGARRSNTIFQSQVVFQRSCVWKMFLKISHNSQENTFIVVSFWLKLQVTFIKMIYVNLFWKITFSCKKTMLFNCFYQCSLIWLLK